jgi:hypothetical protein
MELEIRCPCTRVIYTCIAEHARTVRVIRGSAAKRAEILACLDCITKEIYPGATSVWSVIKREREKLLGIVDGLEL